MKKIHDHAQSALATNSTTSQKKTLKKTAFPISGISGLFKRFQARYGTRWVASIEGIEDIAVKEWSDGLSGLSGRDIKRGLDNLSDEWPPSLPQFKSACIVKKQIKNPAHKEYIELPKPRITKDQADHNISELRKAINGTR